MTAAPPAETIDVICSPYYGWVVERLSEAVRGDPPQGAPPELPIHEANRGPGTTADVGFWTGRDVYPVVRSHLNYVVADRAAWEQSAAYRVDKHKAVQAFVKNAGLGAAAVNVGASGEAFGVADGTVMSVLDLLLATDARAVGGVLCGGNAPRRSRANAVFTAVNQAGGR